MTQRYSYREEDGLTTTPERLSSWGSDSLSLFLITTYENIVTRFAGMQAEYERLRGIHELFDDATECLNDTPDILSAFFFPRAHSCYLGATKLALSGQVPESYMLLRGCIENALYGLYVHQKPASRLIW